MKIRSRKNPDPLHEGTKYLAYVQSHLLEEFYARDGIRGTVRLQLTVEGGKIKTEISHMKKDGSIAVHLSVEDVIEVLSEDM